MSGTAGRSGGHNIKTTDTPLGDGVPASPRALSPRAEALYGWLLDKLSADDPKAGWRRVDGILLASLAECLEDAERLASLIADDGGNPTLIRLRGQLADRVARMSALVGLCPRDRSRLPAVEQEEPRNDPFADLMHRMSQG